MTIEDDAVEAMRDGVDAFRAGKPMSACPHPHGTREGNDWRYGWRAEKRMGGCCERLFDGQIEHIRRNAVGYRE